MTEEVIAIKTQWLLKRSLILNRIYGGPSDFQQSKDFLEYNEIGRLANQAEALSTSLASAIRDDLEELKEIVHQWIELRFPVGT